MSLAPSDPPRGPARILDGRAIAQAVRAEVAAAVRVLLACGKQRQLARDHRLHRHPRQLVGDAWELDDRCAELRALLARSRSEA